MQNPSDLFRFESDADADVPRSGVLVVAVGSFIDAGKIQSLLGDHLVESGDPETVAAFDEADVERLMPTAAEAQAMV